MKKGTIYDVWTYNGIVHAKMNAEDETMKVHSPENAILFLATAESRKAETTASPSTTNDEIATGTNANNTNDAESRNAESTTSPTTTNDEIATGTNVNNPNDPVTNGNNEHLNETNANETNTDNMERINTILTSPSKSIGI